MLLLVIIIIILIKDRIPRAKGQESLSNSLGQDYAGNTAAVIMWYSIQVLCVSGCRCSSIIQLKILPPEFTKAVESYHLAS